MDRRAILLLVACATLTAGAGAQQRPAPVRDFRPTPPGPTLAPTGTASIVGSVTIAGTGTPARRTRVMISAPELRGAQTRTTDAEGRFSFTGLPAGRYSLSASKAGHIGVTFGQHRPGSGRPGTPIQLADGQKFEARLQLPRGGAITGVIVDEHGDITSGISVRAMRWSMQNGQRTLQTVGAGSTDDRGIYRIFNLQPGEYVVCATPRNDTGGDMERMMGEVEAMRRAADTLAQRDAAEARTLMDRVASLQAQIASSSDEQASGYAPVCFPGTMTPSSATAVPLGVSEERSGIDFQLQLAPLARVEGTVINPTGAALQGLQVMMNASGDVSAETRSARPDADGRFRIPGVPPGQYTITARASINAPREPSPANAQEKMNEGRAQTEPTRLWALMDVAVDGRNLTNVILQMQQGMTISGHIAFDGAEQAPADFSRMRVSAMPLSPGTPRELAMSASGRVEANGRFTIANVMPGRYRLSAGGAGNPWSTESAIVGGQDTLDVPLDVKPNQNVTGMTITLSDRQTEFSGAVVNERNEPVTAYTIVVFSTDSRFWTAGSRRIQTARTATDGRFTLRGLPPGEYRLVTVFDPEPGSWFDPAYLQQLQGSSTTLTLQAGEKKNQDVRVASR